MPVALDAIEGHEAADPWRSQGRTRLTALAVPEWAYQLRLRFLSEMQTGYPNLHGKAITYPHLIPAFLVRCEVAMAGLWLLYPDPEDRHRAYGRAAIRFLKEVLRPVVARATASTEPPHQQYDMLIHVFQLCESDGLYQNPKSWTNAIRWQTKKARGVHHLGITGRGEILADAAIWIARSSLFQEEYNRSIHIAFIVVLGVEYHGCYGKDQRHLDRISQHFLDALEAESPEPDWMPRTRW